MSRTLRHPSRLLPASLVLAALPLLAATCGSSGTGAHAFARHSLIIPMDACFQGDGKTPPTACPGAADPGNVLRAYGLVYQLLQNNIPVYWIIQPTKASLTDVDLTVAWSGGAPVAKYA
ncbi:MAG: hypothetical protein FJ086_20160 [Deltaproteobacteria bacterium]|nr:hypothetical protein [Deltaproteobacteria bacterium]